MMGKKKAKQKPVDTAKRSEIIQQCVIYVQQLAAYDAGFDVDRTGDSDFASKGGQIKKARRAMCKLIGLSPHKTPARNLSRRLSFTQRRACWLRCTGSENTNIPTRSSKPTSASLPARCPTFWLPITRGRHEAPAPIDQEAQPAADFGARETTQAVTAN
jgi:hypothetical protein